jgi:hypothetical protein
MRACSAFEGEAESAPLVLPRRSGGCRKGVDSCLDVFLSFASENLTGTLEGVGHVSVVPAEKRVAPSGLLLALLPQLMRRDARAESV